MFSLRSLSGFAVLASALLLSGCDKGPTKSEAPTPVAKTAAADDTVKEDTTTTTTTAPPAAKEGATTYGAGVDTMQTVSISELVADPEAFEGKIVQVEGMVTDVCAKRGCWFEMAGKAPGEKARFKVQDGEMVFPMSAKGKTAVAQGKIVTDTLSLEETRAMEGHYASESGREFDPESITEGKTVFRIEGTGAVISD